MSKPFEGILKARLFQADSARIPHYRMSVNPHSALDPSCLGLTLVVVLPVAGERFLNFKVNYVLLYTDAVCGAR